MGAATATLLQRGDRIGGPWAGGGRAWGATISSGDGRSNAHHLPVWESYWKTLNRGTPNVRTSAPAIPLIDRFCLLPCETAQAAGPTTMVGRQMCCLRRCEPSPVGHRTIASF